MRQDENNGSLKGRLIIVAGASSGVGYATVRRLVQVEGATVVAIARRRVFRIEALAKHARGGQLLALTGDMSVATQAQSLVNEIHQRFGTIHGFVHAVHRSLRLSTSDVSDHDFDLTMRVNVKSALHGVQATSPVFEKQQHGAVVIYNPKYPHKGEFGTAEALHAASSNALEALTEGWTRKLAQLGITVISIDAQQTSESHPGQPSTDHVIAEALKSVMVKPASAIISSAPSSNEHAPVIQGERGGLRLTWFGS